MKREIFALGVVALFVVVFPASLFGYQAWRTKTSDVRVIDVSANAPDAGGWQPATIRVNVGERVRLRISSPDVVHGFEIPALNVRVDEILPGHVQEVEFVASRAGRFPFACTRWCSVDHWRMRGVIFVTDIAQSDSPPPTYAPPLYQQLNINLDEMHPAQKVPAQKPSASRGAQLNLDVGADFRARSPSDVFAELRVNARHNEYTDARLWDAIAFNYFESEGDLKNGARLFARDCAACHGERGDGTGPAGKNLPGLTFMHSDMKPGPADFTNASEMFGASDALLQGKILRGGMGTGMPEWGSLYSAQDMWDVVAFLRTFTFEGTNKSP
ncbi:c-type cytochrome [Anaerolineae bacterium CFX7]|nr:c-type cytochrome [Anaerolineae bacterium CFX7]